ncbi:MAG: signal peptidase II [Dissulfurispiraceae bacterium]|jgi:signal peptidase II|nr:signal peptidase II [Dissulfurispiraceae bacterium]
MTKKIVLLFLLAAAVFILDQATKLIILKYVGPYDIISVTSFLNIVFVENTGSAFGMFKSLGNIFFIMVALAAMMVVSYLIVKSRQDGMAFALVLGGAAGNLLDRITRGAVVDFLDFHAFGWHWPAFNVADTALTVGVGLLFISVFLRKD